jgi:hypothetical protein
MWFPEFKKVKYKYESYGMFMDDYPEIIENVRRKSMLFQTLNSYKVLRIKMKPFYFHLWLLFARIFAAG